MFKIPTYEDLEKQETEFNKERLGYTGSLFLKRKTTQSGEESSSSSTVNASTENEIHLENPEPKKLNNDQSQECSPFKSVGKNGSSTSSTSQINGQPADNEDDEDDELLNMFIKENKEIIEAKSTPKKSNAFAVPSIPGVVKFDPKMPVRRVESTTSSSSKNTFSSGGGALIVSSKQRGNGVLKSIRNVAWNFCDQITPDYQMSRSMCGFFLSMKYHLLNPTYIHKRIREIGRAYEIRVLLALVDVKEPRHCIKELEKFSIVSNLSLILCWSNEEVARYLETFKAYEFKSAEAIMEKATTTQPNQGTVNFNSSDANFVNSITDFLCQIKSINKTDASTLRQTYGSIKQLSQSSREELNLCPGLGPLKVNRLHEIFKVPFLLNKK